MTGTIQTGIDLLPATGAMVFCLDGKYYISSSLVLDSYQTLRGCGRNTIFTASTADLDIITATGSSGSEKTGILIADLCIDGDAGGETNDGGIYWTYVDDGKILNVWVQDCGENGIKLTTCDHNTIANNWIEGCTVDGMYLVTSTYNTFANNNVNGNNGGIDLDTSSHYNTITFNISEGNTIEGIYLNASEYNTVSGNNCEGNGESGIILTNSADNNTISANICKSGTEYGIYVDGSDHNAVRGNVCNGYTLNGIFLDGSDNCTVTSNICNGNSRIGIYIYQSDHNNIVGNSLTENSQGTDDTYDDINIEDSDYNNVQGNLCRAGGQTNKPKYGINISGATCNENKVINNDLYDDGFGTGELNDAGTGTIIVEPGIDDIPVDGQTYQPISSNWAYDHQTVTNAPTGFPNRTDSTLSFATITFTIAPSNGSFDYYIAGIKYTKSSADSIAIDDTTSGAHFIYYDGATLSESISPNDATMHDLIETKALVGIVYWNATDDVAYLLADERHGGEMSGATHAWLHETNGAAYHNGLTLSGYTEDTDSDAALTFEITDGAYDDEDLEHVIIDGSPATQYSQQLNGGDASIPIIYKDDVDGSWTEDAATTLPYKSLGAGRLAYNKDDGDGTFSQVEVGDGDWVSMTLIATNDWQYPIKAIQGENEYTDKKTAVEQATAEVISFGGGALSPEVLVLYRLVLRTKDTFGGTKKTLIEVDGVTDFRTSSIIGGAAVATDHGAQGGLGDDDHAQYFLLAGETTDAKLHSGADLIVYSDAGSTEKARIDGATGAITTSSTVDGIDIAGHDAADTGVHGAGGDTLATDADIDTDVATHAAIKSANATLGHVIVEDASKIDVDGDGKLTLGAHASTHDSGGADQVHSITDDDDDTGIETERTADDDILYLKTAGTDCGKFSAVGIVTFAKQSMAAGRQTSDQTITKNTYVPLFFDTEETDIQDEMDMDSGSGTAEVGTAGTTLHDDGVFAGAEAGDHIWNTSDDTYWVIASVTDNDEVETTGAHDIAVGETFTWFRAKFTVKEAGVYMIVMRVLMLTLADGKYALVGIYVDGTQVSYAQLFNALAGGSPGPIVVAMVSLTAGQVIEGYCRQNDTVARDTRGLTDYDTRYNIAKIA